jgi:hypothetical protein
MMQMRLAGESDADSAATTPALLHRTGRSDSSYATPLLVSGPRARALHQRALMTPDQAVLRVLADRDPNGSDSDDDGADSSVGGSTRYRHSSVRGTPGIAGGDDTDVSGRTDDDSSGDEIDMAELEMLTGSRGITSSLKATPIREIIDMMLTPCGGAPLSAAADTRRSVGAAPAEGGAISFLL